MRFFSRNAPADFVWPFPGAANAPRGSGRDTTHETNVSTQQAAARAHPRLSQAHGHPGRPQGSQPATGSRPQAPGALVTPGARPGRRKQTPGVRPMNAPPESAARGGQRFRKHDRLRRRSEYLELGRRGQRIHSRYFTVIFGPGKCPWSRLGLTVSRRVGCAVTRNRVKRLCREGFRRQRDRLGAPLDINLIAKPSAAAMRALEAFDCLAAIFQRLGSPHDGPSR